MSKRLQINVRAEEATLLLLDVLAEETNENKTKLVNYAIMHYAEHVLGSKKYSEVLINSVNEKYQEEIKKIKERIDNKK